VNSGPQLDPQRRRPDAQLLGAVDRRSGLVERDQEAIAAVGENPAPGRTDPVGHDPVVALKQFAPPAISEPGDVLGRADDVRDQQRLMPATGGRLRLACHPEAEANTSRRSRAPQ
jgi:hypothetical protein